MKRPPFLHRRALWILGAAAFVLACATWRIFRTNPAPASFVCPYHPDAGEHSRHAPLASTWKNLDVKQGRALLSDLRTRHEANPGDTALLSELMHVALDVDPATALRLSEDLLARDPDSLFALNHGALALLHLGKPQAALTYATRCLNLADTAENRTIIGHIHRRMGQETQAEVFFRRALDLDPDYQPALIGLGRAEAPSP